MIKKYCLDKSDTEYVSACQEKKTVFFHAINKSTDQPVQSRRLIRAFIIRLRESIIGTLATYKI